MKCVQCRKPIAEHAPFMTVPDPTTHCGPRGQYRKPPVFWCEPCWSESVRAHDKFRADSEAERAAEVREARMTLGLCEPNYFVRA